MIELFLYVFSIMYTPGPVTTIAFNAGLDKKQPLKLGFAAGVAVAMYILLLACGYSGQAIFKNDWLPFISLVGGIYIIYLAIKVITSARSGPSDEKTNNTSTSFSAGFIIHIVNPKAWLAALPLVVLYYPTNHIHGWGLFFMSALISIVCGGSSIAYNLAGRYFAKIFKGGNSIIAINYIMGLILIYSGTMILYEHFYIDYLK